MPVVHSSAAPASVLPHTSGFMHSIVKRISDCIHEFTGVRTKSSETPTLSKGSTTPIMESRTVRSVPSIPIAHRNRSNRASNAAEESDVSPQDSKQSLQDSDEPGRIRDEPGRIRDEDQTIKESLLRNTGIKHAPMRCDPYEDSMLETITRSKKSTRFSPRGSTNEMPSHNATPSSIIIDRETFSQEDLCALLPKHACKSVKEWDTTITFLEKMIMDWIHCKDGDTITMTMVDLWGIDGKCHKINLLLMEPIDSLHVRLSLAEMITYPNKNPVRLAIYKYSIYDEELDSIVKGIFNGELTESKGSTQFKGSTESKGSTQSPQEFTC